MKASELIAQLQELMSVHGDQDMTFLDTEWGVVSVDYVSIHRMGLSPELGQSFLLQE